MPEGYACIDGGSLIWRDSDDLFNWSEDVRLAAEVTISKPYLIGKTQVTWGQYRAFCKATQRPLTEQRALRQTPILQ